MRGGSEGACSFGAARRGLQPLHPDPLFFAPPKKRGEKKGGPAALARSACGQAGSLWCSTRGPRAELAALASLPPLKQAARVRSRCAPAAHGPLVCAPRRRRRRATANSQQPNLEPLTAGSERIAGCWGFGCSVSHPLCAAEEHSKPARVPQARIPSDSASLFEQSERSERREFWPGPACEHRREPLAAGEGRAQCGAAFLFPPFLWRSKEKGVGCRGEAPARESGG